PHAWFASFYALSVAWSLLWATQVLTRAAVFRAVCDVTDRSRGPGMSARQVMVVWSLMLVQGSRRLWECLAVAPATAGSKSRMWVGHWLLGLAFYVGTSIAVWVEGVPALRTHEFTVGDVALTAPDVKTFVGTLLFILASGWQHDCHAYLASLKSERGRTATDTKDGDGYRLPDHPAFARLIAPHYTAECVIYLALAILGAPTGAWVNGTLLCALIFVIVNLGVTAHGTKQWYERRFGNEAVAGKWRMLPFIF
ncbi:3-oxo-5-alpha-steroid 4-dehydrogenase, partial [Teratosphaeria destructans]